MDGRVSMKRLPRFEVRQRSCCRVLAMEVGSDRQGWMQVESAQKYLAVHDFGGTNLEYGQLHVGIL
jgi:hypothetical protein